YLSSPADATGRSQADQVLGYVRRQAEERRCARLYWHTQESNHRAQRLYDWVADKPGVIEYRIEL
ncbi:GNAT family N-acetyltransferase, partial [Pseudomonas aeruginosa]